MSKENSSRDFYKSIETELRDLRDKGNFRSLVNSDHFPSNTINLSSNDYLGLKTTINKLPPNNFKQLFGSTSSRLLTGNHSAYEDLENTLSEYYSPITEEETASLIFNSGYHANTGIIPAITGKDDLILSDKLNHASIIDGSGLSRATTIRFPHKDYKKLRSILEKRREEFKKVVIISESVFSMDGDSAEMSTLVALKKEFDCLLYIDEAHSCGVFGSKGLGLCESTATAPDIDIILGTFGKAYASLGAYAIVRPVLKDFLINRCRSLIFTTALPSEVVEWSHSTFRMSISMDQKRFTLQETSRKLREELCKYNLPTGGNTHIIPVYTGSSEQAVTLAKYLNEKGFLIFPIRPPTVPPKSSRIRISLTADIKWKDIAILPELIASSGVDK